MADKIPDYATGKEVSLAGEEYVRQQYERILIDELGYPKANIDIEFPIQRGSRRGNKKADIAVFRDAKQDQKNLRGMLRPE